MLGGFELTNSPTFYQNVEYSSNRFSLKPFHLTAVTDGSHLPWLLFYSTLPSKPVNDGIKLPFPQLVIAGFLNHQQYLSQKMVVGRPSTLLFWLSAYFHVPCFGSLEAHLRSFVEGPHGQGRPLAQEQSPTELS